ncbi:hypothetical protein HK099_005672 [Clydaea vesicula]|uniref:Velvet domain-containing protein n=1 Tax=Clydaea vesicula TaxID=447962 RepID=A0AAD5XZG7_9FUNG|nr:hypothetical protein HK099_005672 [Clydaea vesicula]KAJ3380606.1 hypothetical protein HDU92_005877 [Lobulomyces angularis]
MRRNSTTSKKSSKESTPLSSPETAKQNSVSQSTEVESNVLLESSLRRMHYQTLTGEKKYRLVIRQQPFHVRMCGSTDKDRRTLDPPPIIEILEVDEAGHLYPIIKDSAFYIMRVELWNEQKSEITLFKKKFVDLPLIIGDLVVGSKVLSDDLGRTGTFFVFDDVSIRYQGRYRLKFKFYDIESGNELDCLMPKAYVLSEMFSQEFVALTAREFPGMLKSAEITKHFKTQGLRLSIRN